jgi:hypothetical protein
MAFSTQHPLILLTLLQKRGSVLETPNKKQLKLTATQTSKQLQTESKSWNGYLLETLRLTAKLV